MSISTKIVLIMLFGFTAYALVVVLAQRGFVAPSFETLEQSEAVRDMERVILTMENEIGHLDTLTWDWAAWDDTYEFVRNRNALYIDSNLIPQTFDDTGLNLIAFYDTEGRVIWSRSHDLTTGQTEANPDFPESGRTPHPGFLVGPDDENGRAGVFVSELGPMLLAARPVTTSDESAEPVGTLIMGRLLDRAKMDRIAELTGVDAAVWKVDDPDIPPDILALAGKAVPGGPPLAEPVGPDLLRVVDIYSDLEGRPALLIRVDLPRPISIRGNNALIFDQTAVLLGGLTVLVAVLLSLQHYVIRPLTRLTAEVVRHGQSENPLVGGERLVLERADEIGTLSREFAALVDNLAQARNAVRKSAYRTGQSEMARGLLHNLRNAMTPLVSHLDMILTDLRGARLDERRRAREELDAGPEDPERREKLLSFLALAADRDAQIIERTEDKVLELTNRADAIERVVRDFEGFTRAESHTEPIVIDELVREALELIPAGLRNRFRLETIVNMQGGSVDSSPPILLQVMVHLLTNAAESVARRHPDPESGEATITVRAWRTERDARISFQDTGAGIDPKDLPRVFERDFSTSRDQQRGFGLHWCSGVLNQLGGRLSAQSPGPGRGATFTILLPVNPLPKARP